MAEVSAHLVDKVLPKAPVRQWVLSVPRPVRYLLARDASLLSAVIWIFITEVFRDLRRRSPIRPASRLLCGISELLRLLHAPPGERYAIYLGRVPDQL